MRSLLLSLACLGLASPAWAQPPVAQADHASRAAPAAHSPIGAAMAKLTLALHDAAEQARQPAPAAPAVAAPAPAEAPAQATAAVDDRQPQPTVQVALP